eukprot:CAMPEP_0201282962 /NCGR_PEP_ID=MMETSP1317-20130820/7147_1 /ASSEMBLY_ACC=CAM_ASM_000770 /TAXON_ID=187299 /ORGANISM="Undescribed Undescribed, Strain Undescribed" /LENGTH=106 /DNA_ID=CAMNT_0047597429 /DNA_START=186 /DNA_END=506 /DNA_ORIENTATION=-
METVEANIPIMKPLAHQPDMFALEHAVIDDIQKMLQQEQDLKQVMDRYDSKVEEDMQVLFSQQQDFTTSKMFQVQAEQDYYTELISQFKEMCSEVQDDTEARYYLK